MEAMQGSTGQWTWPEHVFTGLTWKADVTDYIKQCLMCIECSNLPVETLQPHEVPPRPWVKTGVDFFQDHLGKKHLIVADYLGKFPYVFPVASAHHFKTIIYLRELFSAEGVPTIVMSDNGPYSMVRNLGSLPVNLTLCTPHHHPISINPMDSLRLW